MPVIVFPLAVNLLILMATWVSQLTIAVKILITALVAIKTALHFYSFLVCDTEWAKICCYTIVTLLNVAITACGIVYGITGLIVSLICLVVMLLLWTILPCIVVNQEKEGSR